MHAHACLKVAAVTVVLVGVVAGLADPAGAHTAFESSDPAAGSSVAVPVSEITLVFTGQAQPSGQGFEVLDPAGTPRTPAATTTPDGRTWVLRFDPPLAGGPVGVAWTMQAPDAHPISGAFSFEVTAPATTEGPQPEAPATGPPGGEAVAAPPPQRLESFLADADAPTSGLAERVSALGRIAGIGGVLAGVGGLVFAALVLRGEPDDTAAALSWVRRDGALVVVGALIELAGHAATEAGGDWSGALSPSTLSTALRSSMGGAIGLRLAGGIVLAMGARSRLGPVTGDAGTSESPGLGDGARVRLPVLAAVGGLVAAVSFIFDGHTASKGSRAVTAGADLVHVGATAVWAGGLLALAAVLWRRHRRGDPTQVALVAARFSVVAATALVAAGISGAALSWIVLDEPAQLLSSPWGRLLMAKLALVAVAASIGAYNHRVLVPALAARSAEQADPGLADHFRRAVTVESAALVAAVAVTAFLVGATT